MALSGMLGAGFALVYPLLLLPQILLIFLKIAVGFLLCLLPFPRLKTKKDLKKFALNAGIFFALTFLYGGALTALFSALFPQKTPVFWVVIGFAVLSVCTFLLVQKIYEKRKLFQHIYACEIIYNQKITKTLGFRDSGNLASKNGVPVCFVSPDIFYDVFGEEILFQKPIDGGQVFDEMVFTTMSGEKKARIYMAKLRVEISGKEKVEINAYFCLSANMLNREYKVLLNAGIIRD